jgi:hypothetical protein
MREHLHTLVRRREKKMRRIKKFIEVELSLHHAQVVPPRK